MYLSCALVNSRPSPIAARPRPSPLEHALSRSRVDHSSWHWHGFPPDGQTQAYLSLPLVERRGIR